MDMATLEKLVESVFGKRGGSGSQEATGALGVLANGKVEERTVFFYARQGGPMPATLVAGDKGILFDARNSVATRRNKGEWTGYHAEMIIVSAIFTLLKSGPHFTFDKGLDSLRVYMHFLGVKVAANAPCCKHCNAMLGFLGIERPDNPGGPSNTGWWNPLTDVVYAQADEAFKSDIPGGTDLDDVVKAYFGAR